MWSKKKMNPCNVGEDDHTDDRGLRILIKTADAIHSKVVVQKPLLGLNRIVPPMAVPHRCPSSGFLKSCHLCRKTLSLDKEVYMYRGDLGFCSVECRERRMYLDEMEEREICTRKILARRRHGGGRGNGCEASSLSEEFRQRRRHAFSSAQKSPVIFSYS